MADYTECESRGDCDDKRAELIAARVEIERLHAALKRYGLHKWDCPENDLPTKAQACTCGFKEFEEKKQPANFTEPAVPGIKGESL